ncbi:MAG: HNH endonuclease [Candidatus Diapherotrites archaeon]
MARTYIDENGYRRFSDSGKLVHRWAAEQRVGSRLYPNQRVHHINRNKLDNRPSNLWVFNSQREHTRAHMRDKRRFGFW